MERIYEEVKTPFKYGLVMPGRQGHATDCPTIFRQDGKWYMCYFVYDGRGYETGDLSVGIAFTDRDPAAPHEWQRLSAPVLSPRDADVSWWDNDKIYKNSVIRDPKRLTGHPFVMYYNAKGDCERIGMAVSDDMLHWRRFGADPVLEHGDRGIALATSRDMRAKSTFVRWIEEDVMQPR